VKPAQQEKIEPTTRSCTVPRRTRPRSRPGPENYSQQKKLGPFAHSCASAPTHQATSMAWAENFLSPPGLIVWSIHPRLWIWSDGHPLIPPKQNRRRAVATTLAPTTLTLTHFCSQPREMRQSEAAGQLTTNTGERNRGNDCTATGPLTDAHAHRWVDALRSSDSSVVRYPFGDVDLSRRCLLPAMVEVLANVNSVVARAHDGFYPHDTSGRRCGPPTHIAPVNQWRPWRLSGTQRWAAARDLPTQHTNRRLTVMNEVKNR
jgi:hypothetical protein